MKLSKLAEEREFNELSTDEKVAYIERLLEETYLLNELEHETERHVPEPLPHERQGRHLTDDVKEEIGQ